MIKRIVLSLVISLFWLTPAFGERYPILVVHGINDVSQTFKDACIVKTLQNAGFDVFTF